MQLGLAFRRPVGRELRQHADVARPDLLQEQPVHQPRGVDHLGQRLPLVLRQRVDRRADVDRREPADLRVERRDDG